MVMQSKFTKTNPFFKEGGGCVGAGSAFDYNDKGVRPSAFFLINEIKIVSYSFLSSAIEYNSYEK